MRNEMESQESQPSPLAKYCANGHAALKRSHLWHDTGWSVPRGYQLEDGRPALELRNCITCNSTIARPVGMARRFVLVLTGNDGTLSAYAVDAQPSTDAHLTRKVVRVNRPRTPRLAAAAIEAAERAGVVARFQEQRASHVCFCIECEAHHCGAIPGGCSFSCIRNPGEHGEVNQ